MYNRYSPQPDGSYQRNRCPDNVTAPSPVPPCPPPPKPAESPSCSDGVTAQPQSQSSCGHPSHKKPPRQPSRKPEPQEPAGIDIGAFLRQLLPKNFDTGDLIVILLLLLMSSDCREDQNTALLTLVIYLFL